MKTWQKVIFRNYGCVEAERLAAILQTDVSLVHSEAAALGISGLSTVNPDWVKKGFVTLVRNDWDLLSVEQIAFLLGKERAELETLLIEYDFLNIKLGEQPALPDVRYAPLTESERAYTARFAKEISPLVRTDGVPPFAFFVNRVPPVALPDGEFTVKERFLSSYCADYGNALADDELSDYSEEYLSWLKEGGINGIWISETLRNLADFPLDKKYAGEYRRRVVNLKKLTERCKRQGVNVYLYLNEPRSLPAAFFEKYPRLRGQKTADGYCLCTSCKEVRDYLYDSVKSLAKNVPLLKGVMTISMSENPTHCYSIKWDGNSVQTDCPRCKERTPQAVAAEVNNILAKGLQDGNGYTKLIANLWGWSDFMGWTEEMAFDGIDRLDKDVEVLCVSEYGKEIRRGGVPSKIIDYSISEVGPSEISKKMLAYAKGKGHKIWAKVQMNNSWECSAVPYLPTFGLMSEHVKRLKNLGVEGLMLGWSQGGYPGGVLPLISRVCMEGETDEWAWYQATYQEKASLVRQAGEIFGEAFGEFPFSIDSLYFGGHTLGCGNLWSLQKDNRPSTMVCFTFDDYENWTKPYGLPVYIQQMEKLTARWRRGLALLEGAGNPAFEEWKRYARVAYIQFKSAENLAKFTYLKGNIEENKGELLALVNGEKKLAEELLFSLGEDAKIGYEMSNHYFYNANLLLEKVWTCAEIADRLR